MNIHKELNNYITQLLNKECRPLTKQLYIDLVILVNTCIVVFMCMLNIQVMKHTKYSLPL